MKRLSCLAHLVAFFIAWIFTFVVLEACGFNLRVQFYALVPMMLALFVIAFRLRWSSLKSPGREWPLCTALYYLFMPLSLLACLCAFLIFDIWSGGYISDPYPIRHPAWSQTLG